MGWEGRGGEGVRDQFNFFVTPKLIGKSSLIYGPLAPLVVGPLGDLSSDFHSLLRTLAERR